MTYRRCAQCGRTLSPTESAIETTEDVLVTEDGTDAIETQTVLICRSCSSTDITVDEGRVVWETNV